jgi:DNA-directed RNA polymerase subunit RPC12/RpoP
MVECPNCDFEIDEEDPQYECPYCGEMDGEGFYVCENCGMILDWNFDTWECQHCYNDGVDEEEESHCEQVIFIDVFDDDDDDELIPDVNQGWVGERYGK